MVCLLSSLYGWNRCLYHLLYGLLFHVDSCAWFNYAITIQLVDNGNYRLSCDIHRNLVQVLFMSQHIFPCVSCPVIFCHVLSCPVMSCDVLLCTLMSFRVLSCPLMPSHVLSCPVMYSHVLSCHDMSCFIISEFVPAFDTNLTSSKDLHGS